MGDDGPVPEPAIRWRVVVPVKHADLAKTRLVPPASLSRPDLARAVARDTLEAVCRAVRPEDVVVATSDPSAQEAALELGALVEPDPGDGLNAAVRAGLLRAQGEPGAGHVAVLLGDLPALRPQDLAAALAACAAYPRSVVPDAEGTGTVLLTATPGHLLAPSFGAGSAARHATGATLLTPDLPRLRQDVDDVGSLAEAVQLGVGRHTAAVLARACLPGDTA
jgi:2-phospho-L-lactate guanylyltransferase